MAHIIIVEDDDNIRLLIHDLLVMEGHSVHAAADGRSAMQGIRDDGFDLVITDIFMPEQDGFELIMEMRHNYAQIKIIAMSGDQLGSQFGSLRIAQQLGAHAIMPKPFRPDELINLVNQVLAA
ncbi:MAG: response regulator, partial [Litorilinea sp.]